MTPRHAEYDYQAHSTDLRTLMALFTPAASAATMTMPPVPGTGGTAMPGMRFLSSDTAIMTTPANAAILASIAAAITDEAADAGQNTAPDAKSQEMGAYPVAPSGQSGQGTAGVQPHAAVVLDYEENAPDPWGTYYYDSPALSDVYNFGSVNVNGSARADDLGGARDPLWVEPTLIHAPLAPSAPDSGARADEVESWFLANSDTIGRNIIGQPLSGDTVHTFRDWIHGEIKQHHRGSEDVVSDVFHQLATTGLAAEQLNNIYHDVLGRSIDPTGLSNAVATLSYGHLTLPIERQNVAHSQEAANDIDAIWQRVLGRTPDSATLASLEGQLGGANIRLSDIAYGTAHSQEALNDLNALQQQLQGVAAGSEYQPWNAWAMDQMTNGASMADMRGNLAHSDAEKTLIDGLQRDLLGRTPDQYDQNYDNWAQDTLAQGTGWTLASVRNDIAHSPVARVQYQDVYADWGQATPNDAEFATMADAMINMQIAWTVVQHQSLDQQQSEAQQYQALAPAATFQDYVANIAGSQSQAQDLLASMMFEPMIQNADTTQDAAGVAASGGATLFDAGIDQGVAETVVLQARNDPQPSCNDPEMFRKTVPKPVTNIGDITSANAQWQIVNQRDWPDAYKTDGIVWNDAGGGNGPSQQGTPYEAYVQQKLNGGSSNGDYIWLQDHRANWKTFDHWNKTGRVAVSDKVVNTGRQTLQADPARIKYRIWADLKEMAMKYDVSESRQGTSNPITFSREDIEFYKYELGVRADTTTDAQWKEICEAYHGAAERMASYETAGDKPLTFEIDAIS
ncbi:endonuclease toxin domain-containing protein [Acidomonas methanolica]|uniref:endonuclease toxin domain-containing protein n=2 Tax=Acidomonas methanolica TaxID=437 RepID=UPI001C05C607|nr:hypothetical protein [Acidomonas methanolica]MBU2654783.1 hypothetical protein [Acidomonas methanolica]